VTPLQVETRGAVISHLNITDRKLVELKLESLAATDPLTGLPNRRFLYQTGNQELERVRRFNVPAALMMIDVDHFKSINDTYGHAAGDEALRRIGELCKAEIRRADVVTRFGGEEFVVILPGTDEIGAITVAEKLRKTVRNTLIRCDRGEFRITASFGVAEMLPGDVKIDDGMARADMALYLAKQQGRDCVHGFSAVQRANASASSDLAIP
jgi:diguanylate cyclase (GGDEF)-like protein